MGQLGHLTPQNHGDGDGSFFGGGVASPFPNHNVLKSGFSFFLLSEGHLYLLGVLPRVGSGFAHLLAPRASAPWKLSQLEFMAMSICPSFGQTSRWLL